MTQQKTMTLDQFLTTSQIKKCIKLKTVDKIETQVIKPNLHAINVKLEQENDSRYLAYAVYHVLTSTKLI